MLNLFKNNKGEILNLFFKDSESEYYLREIAEKLDREPGYFQQALNSLVREQILIDRRRGNLRFFKLNKNHPLYNEIKSIISKTHGIELVLKEFINNLYGVEYSFIFGSIAKGKEYSESDIDLMIVGNINQDELIKKISKYERNLNRVINYQVYSADEIKEKVEEKNEFLNRVLNEPIIILKGNMDDIKGIRK